MKKIYTITMIMIGLVITFESNAQEINWERLTPEQKNIVSVSTGWDYGMVFGAGYSRQMRFVFPLLVTSSISFPAGDQLLDDFKVKLGGQVSLLKVDNFKFVVTARGIYRRFENPMVRLQNFGSEFIGTAGYYRQKWFVSGDFGFDKAIVTHFKHSEMFRDQVYSDVKDGWYVPATGGYFIYGLQSGVSFRGSDLSVKVGKIIQQDLRSKPLVPAYVQLSYAVKLQ